MISHVTVLTNPASGHGNAPHAAERAIAQWQRRGLDTVEIVGRDGAHARELLREALDRETNFVVYRAEKTFVVEWDTELQAAVLVNWAA